MSLFTRASLSLKSAIVAVALVAGSVALLPAQQAQANDAFVGGLVGGLVGGVVGASLFPPAYPAYPVYAAPPVYYEPAPVVVYQEPVYVAPAYVEPVYAAPVYVDPPYTARPAYSGSYSARPAYPQRRSLASIGTQPPAGRSGSPHVVTYEDTVGGQMAAGSAEPWSPGWFDYCRARFKTFDDRTGTYMGYDSQRHFCVAK